MRHLIFIVFFLFLPVAAWANKVALVIGNSGYSSVPELDNPRNDANSVTTALRAQGFQVTLANDLARVAMRETLREFRNQADRADVALVYYAGHGIEIKGSNYLVPVDARLEDERDAELEMIELDLVLRQISGAKTLKMVVLDACRNNPFIVKMRRENGGGRNVNSGLGRIEYADADTLIAYAAAAGEITPDGLAGRNSPFTTAFLRALDGPPTDVRRLLGRVRDHMRQSVPGAAPFVYTSLGGGEFVINPNSTTGATKPAVVRQTPSPARSISEAFVSIDRAGSFEDWNTFLVTYQGQSDHPLYAFALEKRESLRPQTASVLEPSLRIVTPTPQPEPAPVPVLSDPEAARKLQILLRDRGCYRGAIDGILGRGSRAALTRFTSASGVQFASNTTKGGAPLRAAIGLVENSANVRCIVTQTVRSTPKKTPRKPTAPAVAPPVAPAVAPQVAPTVVPSGSREPNRTKLMPEAGMNGADCRGNRAKFFQCE